MEFTFTYQRQKGAEIEERTVEFESYNLDGAMQISNEFCNKNECRLIRMEWVEDGFRQRSEVAYI